MTGATAPSRAGEEYKKDQELVPILRQRLVESRALERVRNQEHAMMTLAQVSSFCIFLVIVEECISCNFKFFEVRLFCLTVQNPRLLET